MMSACHADMTVPFSRILNPVLAGKDTHYLSPILTLFVCHLRFFIRTLDRCVSLLIQSCQFIYRSSARAAAPRPKPLRLPRAPDFAIWPRTIAHAPAGWMSNVCYPTLCFPLSLSLFLFLALSISLFSPRPFSLPLSFPFSLPLLFLGLEMMSLIESYKCQALTDSSHRSQTQ